MQMCTAEVPSLMTLVKMKTDFYQIESTSPVLYLFNSCFVIE